MSDTFSATLIITRTKKKKNMEKTTETQKEWRNMQYAEGAIYK